MTDEQLKELQRRLVVMNLEGISVEDWHDLKQFIDGLFRNDEILTRETVDKVRDMYQGF